ncbi:MAG TPA: DUF512 domain-containing protein [Firmicutes bacterium]|jgi:MoaA/NifB/PqqE/SkfB family radical SAM enzyme|nr:DUF512 domain-containing protein [Bacillota bacterium]
MILSPTPSPSIEALLYHAQMEGILPITSRCNMGCIFCSNAYNPRGCEIFSIPPRPMEEIRDTILWLGGSRGPVVIGESVTRINEGEPLTHPDFLEILRLVRQTYPGRAIRVTTNASLLSEDLIKEIIELGRVEFVISLNTVGHREKVMGDKEPKKTLDNVRALGAKISFEGSIVALPAITGWEDIENSAKFLKDSGAWFIRILAPGFSENHPLSSKLTPDTWREIESFSQELGRRLKIPVLFEPPGLTSVTAEVLEVLPRSPARKAGIRPGDIIVEVAGRPIFSRTEGFEVLRDSENPRLTYERDGILYDTLILKEKYVSPGLVMYDDLDPRAWFEWERKSGIRHRRVLILTSSLAKPLIEDALEKRELSARVQAVESVFFGGNIQAGGLLTVRDFLAAYGRVSSDGFLPDLVTLPKRGFDPWGRDLEGVSYRAFEEITGKAVVLA